MRKFGPILSIILLLGIGYAVYLSVAEKMETSRKVQVKGLIGSEKAPFFHDERVIEVFAKNGLEVEAIKAGSRQIATSFNLSEYDFAFPAGVPAAEKIRREHKTHGSFAPFFTPMAIATWKTLGEILVNNDLAREKDGYYFLNMEAFMKEMEEEKRWKELYESQDYSVNKSILVNTTDVRKSNSAAMYLSLCSYVANGNEIVQNEDQVEAIMSLMQTIFMRQGFVEYSSQVPFEDYKVMGMGKSPMVMIYEAQFIWSAAQPTGGITDKMVLMYPEPSIFSKHTLVPLSEGGKKLGELLSNDPELQKLAVEYGFRNNNTQYFNDFIKQNNIKVPDMLVNVIEPPSYEILERMITTIEAAYAGTQTPADQRLPSDETSRRSGVRGTNTTHGGH